MPVNGMPHAITTVRGQRQSMEDRTMPTSLRISVTVAMGLLAAIAAVHASADDRTHRWDGSQWRKDTIQVGPRPFYLVEGMDDGALKRKLKSCEHKPVRRTNFSIAHRGAPLQFPEHTKEAYEAGARMGAGIVECDVTFTSDGWLVCRHAQNDLHTTTNILTSQYADRCIKPFTPATLDASGTVTKAASAECRTSELTLDEFKSLRGKMDASNPAAITAQQYQGGTASWRTDLYTGRGTLMTFADSIALNEKLGVKHTPELKAGRQVHRCSVWEPGTLCAGAHRRTADKRCPSQRRIPAVVQPE
jgi:glycerophosphoryl diester phosphodiesterase